VPTPEPPQLLRRVALVPITFGMAWAALWSLPVTLGVALVVDLVRQKRFATARMVALLVTYAVVSAVAQLAAGAAWLYWAGRWNAREYTDATYRLSRKWSSTLWSAAQRIYGLQVETEGLGCAEPGPYLMLPRHVSIADTILPITLLGTPHGLRPRFVVKRALQMEPMLATLGERVPMAFLAPDRVDPAGDRAKINALADELGPKDLVVLYPEGTRYTAANRSRVVDKANEEADADLTFRVQRFHHTLPPQHAGTLAVLRRAPDLDVVFLAHAGLEGISTLRDLFDGELVGARVRIKAWRVPAREIPEHRDSQAEWLDDQWAKLDAWVGAHQAD
jgi:1-acyl-sn-glycerol-3-phosphate acyltransferase